MLSIAVRGVLVACLLKFCNKVVEVQFYLMDPRYFSDNYIDSTNASGRNETCDYTGSAVKSSSQMSDTTWIFAIRYLLPALGGLISSVCCSHIRVLQIGGVILLLSTSLMSVMVFTGIICHPSSPMIPITWLLLPLFYGLTQPSLMHGMFQWHTRRNISTVVSSLYYIVAVIGEVVSDLISPLTHPSALGSKSTLIYISFGVGFMTMTFFVPRIPNQQPFEMPTRARMIRYFQIFSGLILFIVAVSDMRAAVYSAELNFYNNGKKQFISDSWPSLSLLYLLTMVLTSIIVLLIAAVKPRQLSVKLRILSGILLESCVAVGLLIFTLIKAPGATSATIVYSVASVADGIAEVLTMVGSYDLAQRIVPRSSQMFLFGVMFAVWGLANVASKLLVLIIEPSLYPSGDEKPKFFIYHSVILVVLLACACYHKFLSLPLAHQLTPTEEEGEVEGARDEELMALLDSRTS